MKKIILAYFFLLVCGTQSIFALDASVSYASFKTASQNYIEVYLKLIGNTLDYKSVDSLNYQATAEILILLKQDSNIVQYDKYNLNSPITQTTIDFIDVKRFLVDNGTYDLEVTIRDVNREGSAKTYKKSIVIDYQGDGLLQSDIQLLSTFEVSKEVNPMVKHGYYMEPLAFNFYGKKASTLIFYNELYDTDKSIGDAFAVRYRIEKMSNQQVVMVRNKKRQPKAINILLLQLDIRELASGNYRLVVEIRNRSNELLSSKSVDFQRSNPLLELENGEYGGNLSNEFVAKLDASALRYGLKAIAPTVDDANVQVLNMVIASKDTVAQQRFLLTHWAAKNPSHPELAYEEYMKVARVVDRTFQSGFGYGFETDRGFIFLKYGKPHDIVSVNNDPTAPPYEIWAYNNFPYTNQQNVKFLFFNPSLASNDFILLHSNARGELNNPNWEADLYRKAPKDANGNDYFDDNNASFFNQNARNYLQDF